MILTQLRSLYIRILPNKTAAALFYASVAVCIAIWNINIFINDEVTLAAQLFNLGNGVLWIQQYPTKLYEGLSFGTSAPLLGFMYEGHTYAFYTHAVPVFSAPLYGLLYLLSLTIGIRLFFSALWSLSIFMLIWLLGQHYHKPRLGRNLGALISLALLALNAYLGTQLPPLVFDQWGALMAIQLFNILAMAAIVLLSLRIFTRYFTDPRVAAFGAAFILITTPLTFWSVSAKDHTLSVLLITASIWSLYVYLTEGKTRYRYLSYALIGLSFWVRVFDALPLLLAILTTDLLVSTGRIKTLLTAAVMVPLGMIPYFINNVLLFGNPFLSPVYLSAHQEVAQQTSSVVSGSGSALIATIGRLPSLFFATWNLQTSPNWPEHLYHVLFYVNMPVTLSIFQICPLLIIPLFAAIPYLAQGVAQVRNRAVYVQIDKVRAIAVTFFVLFIAHLIIYAPFQDQGFGLDMRFFLPIYIPLIFFTIASIPDVLAYRTRILQGFVGSWIIYVGAAISYVVITSPPITSFISTVSFPFLGTIGVAAAALMALFVPYFVGARKRTKELAILVGFATFVSSYWLVIACWIWQKTPVGVQRPGMMLPLAEALHHVIMAAIVS